MTGLSDLHATFASALGAVRAPDGAFGFGPGEPGTVEPTAVAVLALGDDRARGWLRSRQRSGGGFATFPAPAEDCSTATLAALALGPGVESARALDYTLRRRARAIGEGGNIRTDIRDGWGWTPDTFSWVEPTARVLLALRVLRPGAVADQREALANLSARRCGDGGWNYGNGAKVGPDPRGYLQTTAVALQALPPGTDLAGGALRFVADRWRSERGGLSLAQAIVALRLHGAEETVTEMTAALADSYGQTRFLDNTLTLAWAALATAPDERLAALGRPR